MMRCTVIVGCLIGLLLVLLLTTSYEKFQQQNNGGGGNTKVILTMTTFMDKDNRFDNFLRFMDSFRQHHPQKQSDVIFKGYVDTVVVINEYAEGGRDYQEYMSKHFPEIVFIQKNAKDIGQARSLNILIEKFLLHDKRHTYWIHWEDSWIVERPIIPDLIDIMETSPQPDQLQLTNDWKKNPRQESHSHCTILNPDPQLEPEMNVYQKLDTLDTTHWHLFSLRPSINRLSFYQQKLYPFYFLEDRNLWPIWFEWEFARHFVRCGGVKAIPHSTYASRLPNHKHSYADRWRNDLNR